MNSRTQNLLVAVTAVLIAAALLLRTPAPVDPSPAVSASTVKASPSIAPTTLPTGDPRSLTRIGGEVHTYAVDVSWLKGFPPDAQPGDLFDIWVAWNEKVVKGPNIQLLLKGVALEKIAPPVTPGGPYVAFLFMTRKQSRDFLYGKEYGSLSVTRPTA